VEELKEDTQSIKELKKRKRKIKNEKTFRNRGFGFVLKNIL